MAFQLLIRGARACFRRPEFQVDLVSYDAIPPVSARHVFNAVHGPPSIRWAIEQIAILRPIRREWVSIAHRDRAGQRRANVLVDVCYRVTASFTLTPAAGPADTDASHAAMFARRARQARFHHPPFLGLSEFAAEVALLDGETEPPDAVPLSGSVDLGWMLYDTDRPNGPTTRFFRAVSHDGTIMVPPGDSPELAG